VPTTKSFLTPDDLGKSLRQDVADGLTAFPKTLPPKWFYDERGSELFEEITRLEEYYPTRRERAILTERAAEIAAVTGARTPLARRSKRRVSRWHGRSTSRTPYLHHRSRGVRGALRRVERDRRPSDR
jgi:Histidine-specific methyltransferase, SAM-dependent